MKGKKIPVRFKNSILLLFAFCDVSGQFYHLCDFASSIKYWPDSYLDIFGCAMPVLDHIVSVNYPNRSPCLPDLTEWAYTGGATGMAQPMAYLIAIASGNILVLQLSAQFSIGLGYAPVVV